MPSLDGLHEIVEDPSPDPIICTPRSCISSNRYLPAASIPTTAARSTLTARLVPSRTAAPGIFSSETHAPLRLPSSFKVNPVGSLVHSDL